jgi:hypothetical protein
MIHHNICGVSKSISKLSLMARKPRIKGGKTNLSYTNIEKVVISYFYLYFFRFEHSMKPLLK